MTPPSESTSGLVELEKRLTKPQLRALQWLSEVGGWRAAWWGGVPHTSWPKQMRPATYGSLRAAGLIEAHQVGRLDRAVRLTENGRRALKASVP
jgi:hypothetical protein